MLPELPVLTLAGGRVCSVAKPVLPSGSSLCLTRERSHMKSVTAPLLITQTTTITPTPMCNLSEGRTHGRARRRHLAPIKETGVSPLLSPPRKRAAHRMHHHSGDARGSLGKGNVANSQPLALRPGSLQGHHRGPGGTRAHADGS